MTTILAHAESDLIIPSVADIQARAQELADQAWRQQDTDTYRQLVNLSDALKRGMRMTWVLGDLLVSSATTPGVVYTVSCGACNCPAYKPCKHLKLAEVLLDMLDTLAGDADLEADCDDDDCPDHGPYGDDDCPKCASPWHTRAPALRARCAYL